MTADSELNRDSLRSAYGHCPSGVVAVCALIEHDPVGMAMSTFVPVSLEPPLVAVSVQLSSTTWPRLRDAPILGVSVLAEDQEPAARALSSRHGDRFDQSPPVPVVDGSSALLVPGCAAHFTCSLEAEVPAGDHVIALLRVHRTHTSAQASPLIFHRSSFVSLSR